MMYWLLNSCVLLILKWIIQFFIFQLFKFYISNSSTLSIYWIMVPIFRSWDFYERFLKCYLFFMLAERLNYSSFPSRFSFFFLFPHWWRAEEFFLGQGVGSFGSSDSRPLLASLECSEFGRTGNTYRFP